MSVSWGKMYSAQLKITSASTTTMGDRLKLLRYRKRKSAREAAEEMGITMKSVYAWELGKNNPRLSELIILAEYYGASLDYIVFGR